MTAPFFCHRCSQFPCACAPFNLEPGFEPMEDQRPEFEAYMRSVFPHRDLARYGHSYLDERTRNQWLGWQAKARRMPVMARRA